ncbi:MAG: UDP-N-acetylmuramoyl-L-alanyl-D-glutamate--2,6-diaminopimelate ligase [Planctomycetota bacterium]|jgi:UDP-N-acetylmuramoyl-L-alanyl-D-glutamate--2,6-diaminopimelate ligase
MPTIKHLFANLPVTIPADAATLVVDAIRDDSRAVTPNSLFIARTGEHIDATAHIPDAASHGAVASLVDDSSSVTDSPIPIIRTTNLPRISAQITERFYNNPSSSLRCVGITGTNGKTTIATITTQLLNTLDIPTGTIGSIAIDTGTASHSASLTTPFPLELSRSLAQMRDNNLRACVMEASSIALHQHRCGAIDFDVAVYTNLTGDHLDYHTSMDDYAACKAMLFDSLDKSSTAIVNIDDPHWRDIAGATHAQLLTCSATSDADCTLTIENATLDTTTLTLTGPWGALTASSPLIGPHNAMNTLQALAAAWTVASNDQAPTTSQLTRAISSSRAPSGRLESIVVSDSQDIRVLVDFAHTDDALANVLRTLKTLKPQGTSLTALFGCGGDRDPSKRPRMGRIASQLADSVVLTSDNPRSEEPRAILDDMAQGIDDHSNVFIEPDRANAIHEAILNASPGDTILIAGKGHETYQLLPNPDGSIRKIDFSDQDHAQDALRERLS